jgi:hypothetical protein
LEVLVVVLEEGKGNRGKSVAEGVKAGNVLHLRTAVDANGVDNAERHNRPVKLSIRGMNRVRVEFVIFSGWSMCCVYQVYVYISST